MGCEHLDCVDMHTYTSYARHKHNDQQKSNGLQWLLSTTLEGARVMATSMGCLTVTLEVGARPSGSNMRPRATRGD